ncbi:MAG: hypothetical protein QF809_04795, partial [Candidatus Peribacteraceae bacterium]|nr:hypothetical protein [Candidatus Peribacteraceae bacterium]
MSRRDDSRKIEQTNTHNPVSRESQDAPERSLESAEDLISASDEERNAARSTSETMNKKFSSVDAKAEEAAEELPPGVLRNLSEYFQEYSNHVAKIETNYVSGIRTLLKTTRNRESAIRNSNVVLQSLLADLQKSTTIARFKENSPTHYNRLLSAIQDVRIDSGTPGEKYEIDAPGMDGPFTLVPVHLISGKYEPGGIEYSVDPKTGVTVRGFRDYRTRDHTFYPLSGNRELYSDLHVIRDPSRKPSEELVAEYSRPVDSSEKRKFMERKKKYNQEMNERSERWKISEDMDSRADQLRDGISHLRGTLAEHGEGFARCVDLMQQKHMHHADLPDGDRNSYYVVSNALQNLQKRLHEPDLIKAMEEQVSGENRRHEEWWESDDGSFH